MSKLGLIKFLLNVNTYKSCFLGFFLGDASKLSEGEAAEPPEMSIIVYYALINSHNKVGNTKCISMSSSPSYYYHFAFFLEDIQVACMMYDKTDLGLLVYPWVLV